MPGKIQDKAKQLRTDTCQLPLNRFSLWRKRGQLSPLERKISKPAHLGIEVRILNQIAGCLMSLVNICDSDLSIPVILGYNIENAGIFFGNPYQVCPSITIAVFTSPCGHPETADCVSRK